MLNITRRKNKWKPSKRRSKMKKKNEKIITKKVGSRRRRMPYEKDTKEDQDTVWEKKGHAILG